MITKESVNRLHNAITNLAKDYEILVNNVNNNNQKYIFVFSIASDYPTGLRGIFPLDKETEAKEFADKAQGLRIMKMGEWKGWGITPDPEELEDFEPLLATVEALKPHVSNGYSEAGIALDIPGHDRYVLFQGTRDECVSRAKLINQSIMFRK
jgi:hypothetical protein